MTKTQHDSATPAHGQQVITAVPFIHRRIDGTHQIFLAKRADTKAFLPGVYEMTGGHIDYGENMIDGLRREIREELGVGVSVGDTFACFTYVNKIKGSHSIQVGYFARFVEEDPDINLDPEDHSDAQWFTKEDLVKNPQISRPISKKTAESIEQHDDSRDDELDMIMKGFDILEGRSLDLG